MNILFLSHTTKTGAFRVGSHHLSAEMAKLGHTVAHWGAFITPGHALYALTDVDYRRRLRRALLPRFDEFEVLHGEAFALVPPLRARGTISAPSEAVTRFVLHRQLATLMPAGPDVVLVDQPSFQPLLSSFGAAVKIYRGTDTYEQADVARFVKALADEVDGVIATSSAVMETIPLTLPAQPRLVVNNGVEFGRFSSVAAVEPRVGAVYVGAMDRRFGWESVQVMAESEPHIPIRLAGPVTHNRPALPANVEVIGPVAYAQVPALLRAAKVGILPFSDDPQNVGRSPMKYFEYLAAGLYVVASATSTLVGLGAPGVWLHDGPANAVSAYREALAQHGDNVPGRVEAARHDWSAVTTEVVEFIAKIRKT